MGVTEIHPFAQSTPVADILTVLKQNYRTKKGE